MTNPTPRPRSVIEAEIKDAEQDLASAHEEVADATGRLRDLEDELAKLDDIEAAGSHADEELYAAQHDPRQMGLFGGAK